LVGIELNVEFGKVVLPYRQWRLRQVEGKVQVNKLIIETKAKLTGVLEKDKVLFTRLLKPTSAK